MEQATRRQFSDRHGDQQANGLFFGRGVGRGGRIHGPAHRCSVPAAAQDRFFVEPVSEDNRPQSGPGRQAASQKGNERAEMVTV